MRIVELFAELFFQPDVPLSTSKEGVRPDSKEDATIDVKPAFVPANYLAAMAVAFAMTPFNDPADGSLRDSMPLKPAEIAFVISGEQNLPSAADIEPLGNVLKFPLDQARDGRLARSLPRIDSLDHLIEA